MATPINDLVEAAMTAPPTQERSTNSPKVERFDWRFDPTIGNEEERKTLEAMLSAAKDFAADMLADRPPWILTYAGKSSAGKTLLSNALTRFFDAHLELYKAEGRAGTTVLSRVGGMVKWANVADELRSGNRSRLRDLKSAWFLAIDDYGAEHETESNYTVAAFHELIDARLANRWTVLTTNQSLTDIAARDVRIASRLRRDGSRVVSAPKTLRDFFYRNRECKQR